MRRTRRSSRLGSCKEASLSISSEEEGTRVNTRLSTGTHKAESAYDADEDTTTSDSSSQPASDPYEFIFTEDAPVKTKAKKLSAKVQSRKEKKKVSKPAKKLKSNATSTPVLVGNFSDKPKMTDKGGGLLVTPEVTPILAVQPDGNNKNKECFDDGCNTPTVRRSLRKRSLCLENPQLSAITSFKSFTSQGDSGIGMTPPVKRIKSPESKLSSPSLSIINEPSVEASKEIELETVSRTNVLNSDPIKTFRNQSKRKALVHKTENEIVKRHKRDTSCFGFESPTPDEMTSKRKTNKRTKAKVTSKHSYRTKPVSNSSPDSPVNDPSESVDQENSQSLTMSPTLFSDDLFSDDNAYLVSSVPKGTKSYTSLKGKSQKFQQRKMSKLDSLAQEYNSQFEDIEKFELFIE